jgi:hypothetical protein
MRRSQLEFTLEHLAAPSCLSLTPFKSPARTIVVDVVLMIATMGRVRVDGPR